MNIVPTKLIEAWDFADNKCMMCMWPQVMAQEFPNLKTRDIIMKC